MSFFFGLVTALAVAAYGIYWYTLQPKNRLRQRLRDMPRVPRSRSAEFPPLVPPETAARLMQTAQEPTPALASEMLEVTGEPAEFDAVEETFHPSIESIETSSASADEVNKPPALVVGVELLDEDEPAVPVPEASAVEPLDNQITPEVQSQASEDNEHNKETELQAENSAGIVTSEDIETTAAEEVVGHCARCRAKRVLLNPVPSTTKRGKPGMRGQCAVCGAGIFVFVSDKR